MSSCEGAYRNPNECSRNIRRRVEGKCGRSVPGRSDADAVPPILWDVGFLAQGQPHGARGDTGSKGFVGCATIQLSESEVVG
jgi:hypothetical protein